MPYRLVSLSLLLVLSMLIPLAGIGGLLEPLKWPFQAAAMVSHSAGLDAAREPASVDGSRRGAVAVIEGAATGAAYSRAGSMVRKRKTEG